MESSRADQRRYRLKPSRCQRKMVSYWMIASIPQVMGGSVGRRQERGPASPDDDGGRDGGQPGPSAGLSDIPQRNAIHRRARRARLRRGRALQRVESEQAREYGKRPPARHRPGENGIVTVPRLPVDHESSYRGASPSAILHRLRLRTILEVLRTAALPEGGKLADFGCSSGFIIAQLRDSSFRSEAWELWGLDHSPHCVRAARERGIPGTRFVEFDLDTPGGRLPDSFDVVICLETATRGSASSSPPQNPPRASSIPSSPARPITTRCSFSTSPAGRTRARHCGFSCAPSRRQVRSPTTRCALPRWARGTRRSRARRTPVLSVTSQETVQRRSRPPILGCARCGAGRSVEVEGPLARRGG